MTHPAATAAAEPPLPDAALILRAAFQHDGLVVIAPMIAASGGSLVGRFHRAQLRVEIRRWIAHDKPAIVIMPNLEEHRGRRDRPSFERAGRHAVARLVASRNGS